MRPLRLRHLGFALAVAAAPIQALADEVTVGLTFLTSGLDPAEGSNGWALVSHGIGEQLFRVSREGEIVPELAATATQNPDGNWIVDLAPDRYFSDGTPVTAGAVAEALNRTGELNPTARASAGRLRFEAVDEDTLAVDTEQPTPVLPSVLAEWAYPVYRQEGEDFLFTGAFAVESFEPDSRIEMVPNSYYEGAEARPDVTLRRIADGQSLALAFASGELDMAFNLPVESLPMFAGDPERIVKSFPVGYQYMMWMNTAHPALADLRVRKAIDLAISREDLVTAAQAGRPATGAFAGVYPFAAEGTLKQDVQQSRALLDEAGWTLGEDGVRRKGDVRLELTLLAYPQRPDLVTFQPVVRAALAEIGIAATTQVTENASEVATEGAFDLFLWAQHTASAGDPAQFLALFLESDAARNYTGWSNAEYDALIAVLRVAKDPAERVRIAREAQALLAEEVPVSFLVTPEWHVGLTSTLADYEPWGSDYYVIRPDLGTGE